MTENKVIGTAAVNFRGRALFFTMDGGTFTSEGIEGIFAPVVGGTAIAVYIGNVTYMCDVKDIIETAITHFKTLPPDVQATALPKSKPKTKPKPKAKPDGV